LHTSFSDEREQVVYEMATCLANSRWVSQGLYDRAVKALGHVGITDVITLMGYYTSVSMTLAFYDVPAGGRERRAEECTLAIAGRSPPGESSRNGFGHRAPPIRIAEHSRDPGACRSYHGPVTPACHPGYAEREAARRFHKSDPFSRIDLILRR
jgi:hypothetical protein